MLHKEKDLRWLIKSDDPTQIEVKIKESFQLQKVYQDLICQFDSLNLPLLEKKMEIVVRVIDFVLESLNIKSEERLEKVSIVMRGLLLSSDPDISWLYDVDMTETTDQKKLITELAISIERYNKRKKTEENKERITLEQQLARLNLGFHLDVKKVSVLQFIAYQNEAIKRPKLLRDG